MGGTCEGTSWRRYKRVVRLFPERKVVDNGARDRLRAQIHGSSFRKCYVNSAAVGDQSVSAAAGAVALISDVTAGGADFHFRSGDARHLYRPAAGHALRMNARQVAQRH